MSLLGSKKTRKRRYRHRLVCESCKKEIDSDYKESHIKNIHNGDKVQFNIVLESNQSQLSSFFHQGQGTKPSKQTKLFVSKEHGKEIAQSITIVPETASPHSDVPIEENTPTPWPTTHVVGDTDSSPGSLKCGAQPSNIVNELSAKTKKVNLVSPSDNSNICNTKKEFASCTCSAKSHIEVQDVTKSTSAIDNSNVNDNSVPATPNSIPEIVQHGSHGPHQPILSEYNRRKFSNETSTRDFNEQWYKIYPWLSFDIQSRKCECFPCKEFMKDNSFLFDNWKRSDRLFKHTKSAVHKNAMTKWITAKINCKRQTSVLKQLADAHQRDIMHNRAYLRVIITSIFYIAQQNVALRGHKEKRDDIAGASDLNRGNLLELLHLRCNDIPWLGEKLQRQLKSHIQWTSPSIQNEILNILSDFIVKRIKDDVLSCRNFAVIMDETSDISRIEQVSICLRYVLAGETLETFIGFFCTSSTEGIVLLELLKNVITENGLKLEDIVGECFDGASNMSGIHKGVAARMKECCPRAVYVHCYAHVLNLALQDTMSEIEPLRNSLGTLQGLYNFLEASPKRHAVFSSVKVDGNFIKNLTLKSMSQTRWSCRWEAVKAIYEQIRKVIKALLILSEDKDTKTYRDTTALLNAVCDFQFVLGLILLKVILSNTNALSKYLQGKSIDVINAKRNADLVIKTLTNCRNENNFELLWKRTIVMSEEIKEEINGSRFIFKEAKAPRNRPSRRLQALIGESSDNVEKVTTPKNHHRINTFYRSLDSVIGEMKSRFSKNDQEILCALGDVVLSKTPSRNSFELVAEFYKVDQEILAVEKSMYENSVTEDSDPDTQPRTAVQVVKSMFECGLNDLLPVLYEVSTILASIPATSASAERSFSGLRRVKTYLRSNMGQERLNSAALINIERTYANKVVNNDIDDIINTFGRRHGRQSYFF
ncbi:zinc finger MYM-type protein 1-like [Dendronephthya gigantea]|uniref:zinc finger MYM-type protein 1-like n=1 Tax=Dendronephthya gigantea TaxID=151771 RepID=UPI00106965AB|nr:zinc finger MYM-type protein 1-like [Dendronephthya gigantea]